MSKCNNCGTSLESSSFIDGNTLKCKCGANIHNEVKYVEKVPFMKSIFNFLSEEKHSISFLLVFSEIALMMYGYIIDFHFGNMLLYLFFVSIIFSFLAVPFLIARDLDKNSNCIGETNGYYIFGLFFNFLFILFLVLNGAKEINSNEYEFLPKSHIQSELDDKKITYFEAFKILNREYSASLEAEKEMKKDADNYELEKRELVKEKILKKDN